MDFFALFNTQSNPTIATLTTCTIPAMVKKDRETKQPNPFIGRVLKRSKVNGIVGGWNYASAVNRQRLREANPQTVAEVEAVPDFEALPRSWGTRVPNSGLVQHGNKYYVELKVERSLETTYLIDGQPATDKQLEELKKFLPKKSESTRQGVEKQIILRDYALESVVGVKMNGQYFAADHSVEIDSETVAA